MKATGKTPKRYISCSAVASGAAKPYRPKSHPLATPEWDRDRCIKCAMCYVYCSTGATHKTPDGFFDVDKEKCSGCGICHRECWFGVIGMVEEG